MIKHLHTIICCYIPSNKHIYTLSTETDIYCRYRPFDYIKINNKAYNWRCSQCICTIKHLGCWCGQEYEYVYDNKRSEVCALPRKYFLVQNEFK